MQCVREGWKDKLNEQKNEGCLVTGHLEVNKVAGNFHFAPGKSFQQHHVHGELQTCTFYMSDKITACYKLILTSLAT